MDFKPKCVVDANDEHEVLSGGNVSLSIDFELT